jgi:hypothetical protein
MIAVACDECGEGWIAFEVPWLLSLSFNIHAAEID